MPVYELIDKIVFPLVEEAEPDGLLAVGADLSPTRVLYALSIGIFPWFNQDDPICWWSPDPRFVLFPQKAKISKSVKKSYKTFNFKINHDFEKVIRNCSEVKRPGQPGTWITEEMISTYCHLHKYGYAMSFETYENQTLVGGLYGVLLGKVFIGESMFHLKTDASKCAFVLLLHFCLKNNIHIIDCQLHTPHLESLGAEDITREKYIEILSKFVESPFQEK